MTYAQLVRAVAGATGESPRTIRAFGFGIVPEPCRRQPDDLVLAVTCPRCGHPLALNRGPSTTPARALCQRCHAAFAYQPGDVSVWYRSRLGTAPLVGRTNH